jgi:1,2-diacylglycerol 3-alpha-glucosyltransferase
MSNMKILMIGPANLGPYHYARFRSLVKLVPEFTYVKMSHNEVYRPWSNDLNVAPCRIISLDSKSEIGWFLNREKPDILFIIGYGHLFLLKAAYWAKKNKVPSVLQMDSTLSDHPRQWWKEAMKSLIVKIFFNSTFVAGSRSAAYAESLGIKKEFIWQGVDVVDNDYFYKPNEEIGARINFCNQYFLTVARLSKEKNLLNLLKAFERYCDKGGRWALLIAGTGPEETFLKQYVCSARQIRDKVIFYGWARYGELPSLYHGASCLILPSVSESWGLVTNEAMAAGLPVLVSKMCGCVPELCLEGINGYSFEPFNIEQLAELMLKMSSRHVDLKAMGAASQQIISEYTPEKWAYTVLRMYNVLLNKKNTLSHLL